MGDLGQVVANCHKRLAAGGICRLGNTRFVKMWKTVQPKGTRTHWGVTCGPARDGVRLGVKGILMEWAAAQGASYL